MNTNLVVLAVLMFAVTYPSRALGLLTPGLDRLPKVAFDYLQLVGPAVLAALAAVSVMVVVNDQDVPFSRRAGMAHLLTDEAFALTISHFRRIGRADERGYWMGAIGSTFIPWNLATLAGVLLGAQIPEPARLGIDVIFPAAMVGLAVGLITGRRELVAALVGAGIAVVVALATSPAIGIVAGGVVGPLVGLLVPSSLAHETAPLGTEESAELYAVPRTHLEPPPEPDTAKR